jgi:ribulose kinase
MAAARRAAVALGLDFGTDSVRALLMGVGGVQRGVGVSRYRSGVVTALHGRTLPTTFALQVCVAATAVSFSCNYRAFSVACGVWRVACGVLHLTPSL